MTEQDLRALIRDAVLKALASRGMAGACAPHGAATAATAEVAVVGSHASHATYITIVNPGETCVIEPGVTCNHCGYCRSHGH